MAKEYKRTLALPLNSRSRQVLELNGAQPAPKQLTSTLCALYRTDLTLTGDGHGHDRYWQAVEEAVALPDSWQDRMVADQPR